MQKKKKGRAAPSRIKRAACVLLSAVLILAMAVPGFASGKNTDTGYSVTIGSEGQGSLSFTGSGTETDCKDFAEGDMVSVSAVPEDGYAVSAVAVNDADGNTADVDVDSLVSVDGESLEAVISFAMPACDVYVTVVFAPAPDPSLLADAADGAGEEAAEATEETGDEGTAAADAEEETDETAEEETAEVETEAEEETGEVSSLMSRFLSLFGASSEPVLTALSTSSSITYSRVSSHSYGTYSTYLGLAELDGTSYTAFCLEPNKSTPTDGTYSITEWTNNLARAVAYYGYAGPGYSNSTYGMLYQLFGGDTNNQNITYAYVYQHLALSYVYNGNGAFTGVPDDGTIDAIIDFVDSMNNSTCFATVPNYFHVYQFCTGSDTYQTECFSLIGEYGYAMLIKTSANTSLTSGNEAYYHLGNAIYGVYSDSACTSQVGTLTTTANGSSNAVAVAPGTYYIKETSASTGYQLDSTIYPVTVTTSNTSSNPATVTVTEPPMDIYIRIKKTAYTDISCTTESTVSKVNAKYGIYASYMAAENDTDGSAALEILSTDANGEAACAAAYPLGVYYVKEFESPDGLALDEAIHTVNATSPSYSGQWYVVQSADLETPTYGTMSVTKYGMVTRDYISDAVYYVYSDEDCTTLAYDKNGEYSMTTVDGAESNILTYTAGIYYVKEVASPVGTVLNGTTYPVTVTAEVHSYVGQYYGMDYVSDDEYGWGYLVKENSVDGTIVAGAIYYVYTDAGCTVRAQEVNMYGQYTNYAVLTTTSTGSNTVTLKPGTYYVKEFSAPDGYTLNEEVFSVEVTRGETEKFEVDDTPQVPVKLKKISGNTDFTDGNSNYSLAGAEYGVYETEADALADTSRVATLTTDENGETETLYLDCDTTGGTETKTYYVKELTASPGYSLCDGENDDADSDGIHSIELDPADYETTQEVICVEPPQYGYIEVYKESGNTDITDGNSLYSLLNATYGVYTNENCTGTPVTTITTTQLKNNDKYGYGKSGKLSVGTYYVKEISSPTGYCLDDGIDEVTVESGTTTPTTYTVNSTESPDNDPVGLMVTKIQETDITYLNEYLTDMSGAQFTVKYYAGQYSSTSELPSEATRTWVIQTKAVCYYDNCYEVGFSSREECVIHLQSVHGVTSGYNDYIEYKASLEDEFLIDSLSDELYYDENGLACIPLGTITIEETKYAEGYTTDGSYMISSDGTILSDKGGVILMNVITDHEANETVIAGGGQLTANNKAGNEITKLEEIRRGSITIHKMDSGGNDLKDVTYQLYIWDEDAQDYVDVDSYDGVTSTDKSGTLVYSNLPSGIYRITEVSTADGTSLLAEPIDGITLPLSSEDFDVSSVQNLAAATFSDNGVDYWMNLTFEITNNRVFEIPTAGGSGGIPVATAAGGLCVLVAGLLILVRQKRKSAFRAV